jgi:hypothetical protein
MPRTEVGASCVQRVAVVLFVFAHIYSVLTELAVIRLTLASALVDNLVTVAFPIADMNSDIVSTVLVMIDIFELIMIKMMARCTILAWLALALIYIDITIASEVVLHTLHHRALLLVLLDVGGVVLRASVAAILADAVGEAVDTCALVRVVRDRRLRRRVGACGAIGAWLALTLVNVDVAITAEFGVL